MKKRKNLIVKITNRLFFVIILFLAMSCQDKLYSNRQNSSRLNKAFRDHVGYCPTYDGTYRKFKFKKHKEFF